MKSKLTLAEITLRLYEAMLRKEEVHIDNILFNNQNRFLNGVSELARKIKALDDEQTN